MRIPPHVQVILDDVAEDSRSEASIRRMRRRIKFVRTGRLSSQTGIATDFIVYDEALRHASDHIFTISCSVNVGSNIFGVPGSQPSAVEK